MSKYPVDLGKSMDSISTSIPVAAAQEAPKTVYPSLYLEWDSDYGLPESGEMTVKFNRKSATVRKKSDGSTCYSVELEITSIEDVTPDKASTTSKASVGDILDMLRAQVETDKSEKADEGY